MPDRYWHIMGLLLVLTVVAATHPLRPQQATAFGEELAVAWQNMAETMPCADGLQVGCAMPIGLP
jgi:hypothetical protein